MSTAPTTPLSAGTSAPPLVPVIDPAAPLLFVIKAASGHNDPTITHQVIETALKSAKLTSACFWSTPA